MSKRVADMTTEERAIQNSRARLRYAEDLKFGGAIRAKSRVRMRRKYQEDRGWRELVLGRRLERIFGITTEQWDALLQRQAGCCYICERPMMGDAVQDPVVDHCHFTGVVRGLAHSKCNKAPGTLGDTAYTLELVAQRMREAEDIGRLLEFGKIKEAAP